jgi:hypothetical protein
MHVSECGITCRNVAPIGLKYERHCFFCRTTGCRVAAATEYSTKLENAQGYAYEFHKNNFSTGVDDAIGFETSANRTILTGGECAATGENGIAVRFKGPLRGGYVVEPGIEKTDIGVDLGSHDVDGLTSGPVEDVRLYHTGLTQEDVGVRFGNATGCRLLYPVVYDWGRANRLDEKTFHVAEWTEYSRDCGVVATASSLAEERFRVHPDADSPYARVGSSVPRDRLSELPTGVPTSVDHLQESGVPALHDGDSWKRAKPYEELSLS